MRKWTWQEDMVALYGYTQIPFNKVSNNNELVRRIADSIGRSVAAVKMKIGNFGSFDVVLRKQGITGLENVSRLDREVWDYYSSRWEELPYDVLKVLGQGIMDLRMPDLTTGEGSDERLRMVKTRAKQSFFRGAVMAAYSGQCCISGICDESLVDACHIIPWSEDIDNRLNPSNGVPLNPLLHRLFDEYYISISPDYKVVVSEKLCDICRENETYDYLNKINTRRINLPSRFFPSVELLDQRHSEYLRRQ